MQADEANTTAGVRCLQVPGSRVCLRGRSHHHAARANVALTASGISKINTLINLAVFALMAPAGAAFSNLLGHTDMLNIAAYFNQIMAVVIGIFLHISTTILFESSSDHRFNLYKLSVIILGAVFALFS